MNKKIVVVFGGSGGIGQAICQNLKRDTVVYATYYQNKVEIPGVEFRPCDISRESDVKALMDDIYQINRRIDCVINAVTGKLNLQPFEKLNSEDYADSLMVNSIGGINIIKNAFSYMKQSAGVIITFLSKASEGVPPPRMASYVASKYALKGFIHCVREENKNNNIKFFTISPSFVETDLISVFPPKLLEIEREKTPGQSFIHPEDIGLLVAKMINNPRSFLSPDIVLNSREDIQRFL